MVVPFAVHPKRKHTDESANHRRTRNTRIHVCTPIMRRSELVIDGLGYTIVASRKLSGVLHGLATF